MIAIIGGSGLYSGLSALTGAEQSEVETPFGSVSFTKGRLGENEVIFISRHGDDHPVPPHRVPYKAHIRALKDLGVTRILATSAVGALDEDIPLGSLVLPDQFIDFTREISLEDKIFTVGDQFVDATHNDIRATVEIDIANHRSGCNQTVGSLFLQD